VYKLHLRLVRRFLWKQTEKTKYMLLSLHQNAGHNRNIKRANIAIENVAKFRYLATTVTNQNLIDEEIKSG
jgi:hypothetical protein